jgi:hypothetical protein
MRIGVHSSTNYDRTYRSMLCQGIDGSMIDEQVDPSTQPVRSSTPMPKGSINLSVYWSLMSKVQYSTEFGQVLTSVDRFSPKTSSQKPYILIPRSLRTTRLDLDRFQVHLKLPIFTRSNLDPPLALLHHPSTLSLPQNHGISA